MTLSGGNEKETTKKKNETGKKSGKCGFWKPKVSVGGE